MKNKYGLMGLFSLFAIGAVIYGANHRKEIDTEEMEDYVVTDQSIIIKPLTTDIRKAPEKNSRNLASTMARAEIVTTAKSTAPAPETRANIVQAYRNTLLSIATNNTNQANRIQNIVDYVGAAPTAELPVTKVTTNRSGVMVLADPVDIAKIREPQIRVQWRQLTNTPAPKFAK